MKRDEGVAPSLEGIEVRAREIGNAIGAALPPGVGFCLMLFTFGTRGWSTFLSNAEPESMIAAIRELADKREAMLSSAGEREPVANPQALRLEAAAMLDGIADRGVVYPGQVAGIRSMAARLRGEEIGS